MDIRLCDNIELMKELPDNYIDLIYCDILYGTGQDFGDYKDLKQNRQEIESHYTPRIQEMHRVLKETGTIYLQMDYRISHWMRCLLDDAFGYKNFRNEIIWHYKKFSQNNNSKFLTNHDTILFYSKSDKYTFIPQFRLNKEKQKYMKKGYFGCGGGRYLVYDWNKFNTFARQKGICRDQAVDRTNDSPRTRCDDVFNDIGFVNSQSKQRVGYQTQKPLELIKRIVKASSNEGDLVADFYMGSGTTAVACRELRRHFIGCDIMPKAVEIARERVGKTGKLINLL